MSAWKSVDYSKHFSECRVSKYVVPLWMGFCIFFRFMINAKNVVMNRWTNMYN